MRAVNEAMASGRIRTTLPYIKRESVKILDAEYPDTPTALKAIRDGITGFYATNYPSVAASRRAEVEASVQGVQHIFETNFFPEMKVSWKSYPNNIGHSQFIGCFRCHGEALQSADGKTITRDCTACHSILAQGTEPDATRSLPKGCPSGTRWTWAGPRRRGTARTATGGARSCISSRRIPGPGPPARRS